MHAPVLRSAREGVASLRHLREILKMKVVSTLHNLTPQGFFLGAGLFGGLVLVFLTPPFQVPDEPAHFFRAYSVSEGTFFVRIVNRIPGERLPASLHRLVEVLIDEVPFHPENKIRPGSWRKARAIELEPGQRKYLQFRSAAQYSAFPYLPQAAGVAVGRWFGASPLTLLFLARLANLFAAVALIHLAVRQLPAYRWLAALLALTPMAMFLRSSVSADALTTASAFLLTATVAKLAFGPVSPDRARDFAIVAASSVAVSLTKPVYFPLVVAAAAVPANRLPVGRRRLLLLAVIAISITAVTAALLIVAPSVGSISYSAELRIEEVLRRPFHLIALVVTDLIDHAPRYGAEFIGRLGWLDTQLPTPFLLTYAACLLAFVVLDRDPSIVIAPWQRAIWAFTVASSLMAIGAAMYLFLGRIAGIQGRYFHPMALAVVWIFHLSRWPRSHHNRWNPVIASILVGVSFVVTWVTICSRYYG
jgi:uncharacterized membrane protein